MAELSEQEIAKLHRAAKAAFEKAYAPYSQFSVGAAILGSNGRIYSGCNIENAAYPEGICAEAAALAAMVMGGELQAQAVMLVGAGEVLCTPCGGCRQKLREFATISGPEGLDVLVANPEKVRARFNLGQLLPESFGPNNLKVH